MNLSDATITNKKQKGIKIRIQTNQEFLHVKLTLLSVQSKLTPDVYEVVVEDESPQNSVMLRLFYAVIPTSVRHTVSKQNDQSKILIT